MGLFSAPSASCGGLTSTNAAGSVHFRTPGAGLIDRSSEIACINGVVGLAAKPNRRGLRGLPGWSARLSDFARVTLRRWRFVRAA